MLQQAKCVLDCSIRGGVFEDTFLQYLALKL